MPSGIVIAQHAGGPGFRQSPGREKMHVYLTAVVQNHQRTIPPLYVPIFPKCVQGGREEGRGGGEEEGKRRGEEEEEEK